ncbi:MAG: DUF4143 domain-containing protein [Armatimonadota bacterium]
MGGGFPEVAIENDIILKEKILTEYFNLLVFKDLAERFSIENTQLLRELLKFLFTNAASLFSVNSYFKSVKQLMPSSRQTLSNYIAFIEETDYVFLFPIFSYSLKSQKVNSKKIICLDNGIRNIVSFRFSHDTGKLAENLIGNNLRKYEKEIFYWKDKGEVDFILKDNGKLSAINVTVGDKIEKREIESLLEFKKAEELILITLDTEKKENGIQYIPIWKWLLNT